MKKYIIVVFIIIIALSSFWYLRKGNSTSKIPKSSEQTTSAAKVEQGNISSKVFSTGRVVSNLDVEIKSKASGEVVYLPYDVSDVVKKGDLLVKLDPADEMRLVKEAEITLKTLKSRLIQTKIEVSTAQKNIDIDKERTLGLIEADKAKFEDATSKAERVKKLLEAKLSSPEEYDTAKTLSIQAKTSLETTKLHLTEIAAQEEALALKREDVTRAEADVETGVIRLENSRDRLKDTRIASPIDGVISARNIQIGQIISSGISNVGGGTAMMTISDLSHIFIIASVDESDIGRIKSGQSVAITADAFPGVEFEGQVVRVATKGVMSSNVVTFEVKIEVLGKARQMLKIEMTANVEIILEKKDGVLLLPSEAVYRKRGKRYVYISGNNGESVEKDVRTGIDDGFMIEIKDGLKDGDSVIVDSSKSDSAWRKDNGKEKTTGTRPMGMPMGGGYRRR